MKEQENQFINENKAIWSTSSLHVAAQCGIVASLDQSLKWRNLKQHTTDGSEASWAFPRRTRWQMWKSERQLHSPSWKTLSDADDWGGSDIFHAWNVTGSDDKLIIRNPIASREGLRRSRQNWRRVISKDLKKIGIGWDEVQEATEDAGWTRNQELIYQ